MAEETERIIVIPLKKQKGYNHSKSAPTAIKRVRKFLTRHMKTTEKKIWIDDSLNKAIWSRGKYKLPGKIRVKAVKFEDGVVEAYLPELEYKKSRRELLKEEKEKKIKKPILKKEEEEEEEEETVAPGAEEYEIAPTVGGEIKIKKKKKTKTEEETEKKTTEETKEKTKKKKTEKTTSETKTKEKTKTKKGKEMIKGKCPDCGTTVCRMGG